MILQILQILYINAGIVTLALLAAHATIEKLRSHFYQFEICGEYQKAKAIFENGNYCASCKKEREKGEYKCRRSKHFSTIVEGSYMYVQCTTNITTIP